MTIETCHFAEAASMRSYWIVIILAILVALGLVMVVQSQYQVEDIMNKKVETLKTALERLSNEYLSQDLFKASIEKVTRKSQATVNDMDAAINKLSSEMEQRRTANNACQGEMKSTKEELEHTQKTHKETKASLEAEVEAWTQEIKTLKEALARPSPVCGYVKKSTQAEKLCPNTTSTKKTDSVIKA